MITQDRKMKRGKRIAIAIAALLIPGSVQAESLSLESAIQHALHHSPRLLMARAEERAAKEAAQGAGWPVLLPEVKLQPDHVHTFRDELAAMGPIRFVRLNIFPDGGVSRLRLMGTAVR